MTPEPFSFQHALADFDKTKLPLDPKVLEADASLLAASVQAYYEELLAKLGGTAAVATSNGVVSVQWYPGTGDAVEMVFDHALKLIGQGDLTTAEPLLWMLLGRMPDDPRFLYNLGMLLSDRGETEEAVQLLERLVENEPGSSNGWTALGVAHSRHGDDEKAENAFRRALEINPGNAHALRNLGALTNQSAPEEALEDLWRAARMLPNDQGAQYAYARCLLDLGQSSEADAILTKVIDLDPLSDIAEMAKAERRRLAQETMRANVDGGLRMDAVFYCLDALKKFGEMGNDKMRSVVFEIAVLGQAGLDINDPDEKYSPRAWPAPGFPDVCRGENDQPVPGRRNRPFPGIRPRKEAGRIGLSGMRGLPLPHPHALHRPVLLCLPEPDGAADFEVRDETGHAPAEIAPFGDLLAGATLHRESGMFAFAN